MKMAKPSARDIEAAEELLQILQMIDARFGGPWANPEAGDSLSELLQGGEEEFDCDNTLHLQTLYNHLARLLRTEPNFYGRVIGGMVWAIMNEANQILDPESDCIELHPRFAECAKNANRYLWLRSRIAVSQLSVLGAECSNTVEGVDAGIDAAMAAQQGVDAQPQSIVEQSAPVGEREAFRAAVLAKYPNTTFQVKRDGSYLGWIDDAFWGFQAGAAWQRTQSPGVPEGWRLVMAIELAEEKHGSLRAAARALGIDAGYLSRLKKGEKVNPSEEVLAALGLERMTMYRASQQCTQSSWVPDGWQLVPKEPTAEMIEALAASFWPADWEAGKRLQRLRGTKVVFPKTEIEMAVGKYERVLAAAPAQPAAQGKVHCSECGLAVLDCDKRGCFGLTSAHGQGEVQRLREALPYLRNAVAEASASGVAQLAVVSTKPDGSGKLVCKFECVEFMADLAAVVGAGPQTEDDDARAEARKFLQRNGIASTGQEV